MGFVTLYGNSFVHTWIYACIMTFFVTFWNDKSQVKHCWKCHIGYSGAGLVHNVSLLRQLIEAVKSCKAMHLSCGICY